MSGEPDIQVSAPPCAPEPPRHLSLMMAQEWPLVMVAPEGMRVITVLCLSIYF